VKARPLHHGDTVAATLRSAPQLKLLSPFNEKTPKGEKLGYLTAMLYLAPATEAGGKSVCPHSTEACQTGCLFWAGRGKTPRVQNARLARTRRFHADREGFLLDLVSDLRLMQGVADREGMKLAIRLNGTSDVLWEREAIDFGRGPETLFELMPRAVYYDYTRTPFQHRKVPENWRLVFSLADSPVALAVEHLRAGRSVAAVVPELAKSFAPNWIAVGDREVTVIDGDEHDLRFLDPVPALVLLKPKGRLLRGGPMVRSGLLRDILRADKESGR
jgi:hypothetical protein